jgi:hypothetical protein
MTSVTVQLSKRQIDALKARTGKRNAQAALKAWAERADLKRSAAKLRASLRESIRDASAEGRRFKSAREAMHWLDS